MIAYKDFVPQRLRKQGFIKPPLYETFQQAVSAAGAWVREQEVTVINIETVVLPGLWSKDAPQSDAPTLTTLYSTGQAAYTGLFQFVRVWYHAND